jgi:hypothetical protein
MSGSKIAPISPNLFAGCHVLHRLLPPRHPPDALLLLHQSLQKQTQPKMGSLPFSQPNPPRQRIRSGAIRFQTLSARQTPKGSSKQLSLHNVKQPQPRGRHPQQGSGSFQNATEHGGGERDRTDDLKLAKLALSQLSYAPGQSQNALAPVVGLSRLELPTSRLSGVRSNHLSYRPDPLALALRNLKGIRGRRPVPPVFFPSVGSPRQQLP